MRRQSTRRHTGSMVWVVWARASLRLNTFVAVDDVLDVLKVLLVDEVELVLLVELMLEVLDVELVDNVLDVLEVLLVDDVELVLLVDGLGQGPSKAGKGLMECRHPLASLYMTCCNALHRTSRCLCCGMLSRSY
eukprot:TRINITY_DN12550_c0_g1_i6.p3 TRINITY_DN12550_c0_g1~~TRINITY_DN12550_c0_g1_i6.p3  ORF type:complete len:134 (-),score=31.37 TRINITY_DN12550_c0_g1_i6:64-465(-)